MPCRLSTSITFDIYARKCSVLLPTRPLITVAVVLLTFRFLVTDRACAFFNETSMTRAWEMAPKMVTDLPFTVGMMPFAGVPFRDRPSFLCVCKLKPASWMNKQFYPKSKSRVDSHSSTFSFHTFYNSICVPWCRQVFKSFSNITLHFWSKCT